MAIFLVETHLKSTSSRRSQHTTMEEIKIKRTKITLKLCFSPASMESTLSAATVASDDNLLTEILRRLPAASVLRFKSVSKHWLSLFSHRRFSLLHTHVSTSQGLFFHHLYIPFVVQNRPTRPFRTPINFHPDLYGIRIVQSCNGLLLCCSDGGFAHAGQYYVFNPTTKQYAIVPSVPGGMVVRKTNRFLGLAFQQTECPHFKVVCIHSARHNEELFQIKIYSSYTGKWKISGEFFYAPYNTPFCCGVYWTRSILWAPSCTDPLYFKLDVEQLRPLPVPRFRGYEAGGLPLYFGETGGHLHLVENSNDSLNVYEMLGDHSGWFLKYLVEFHELQGAYPAMIQSYDNPCSGHCYDFGVIDVVRGEKEDDAFMAVRFLGKMIRYNIVEKSFKQIFNLGDGFPRWSGQWDAHRYIKTLATF